MTMWERFQVWRLRPGIMFASRLAEQQAYTHPNSPTLGPEMNLFRFSSDLRRRVAEANQGQLSGLYLNATTPVILRRAPKRNVGKK